MVDQVQLYVFPACVRRFSDQADLGMTDVLSAAMDSGVAVTIVIIFFVLQFPLGGSIGGNTVQKWWGNTVFLKTADGKSLPYKKVPAGKTFGYVFIRVIRVVMIERVFPSQTEDMVMLLLKPVKGPWFLYNTSFIWV